MSVNGDGEWKKWNNSGYWGAPFIWTTLHDFGGNDGMKGNLGHAQKQPVYTSHAIQTSTYAHTHTAQINEIPFAGMTKEVPSSVFGTGNILICYSGAYDCPFTGFTPEVLHHIIKCAMLVFWLLHIILVGYRPKPCVLRIHDRPELPK